MNSRQARLVGAGVTLLLALVFGAITGWVAPDGSGNAATPPTSDTSVVPTPTESTVPPTTKPTPSRSPSPKPTVKPSESDATPSDEPTAEPTIPANPESTTTRTEHPSAAPTPDSGTGGHGAAADPGVEVPSDQSADQADSNPDNGGDSFSVAAAAAGFIGVLVTGFIMIAIFSMAARRDRENFETELQSPTGSRGPTGTRVMSVAAPTETRRGRQDRATLVDALIYVRDRATSTAISDRLAAALRSVGVVEESPVGDRFDPARHEAGGSELTTDPGLIDTVSGVEVVGYTDADGTVLRPPVVTVYRREGQ